MVFFPKPQNQYSGLRQIAVPAMLAAGKYAYGSARGTRTNLRFRQGGVLTETATKKRKTTGKKSFKDQLFAQMAAKHDTGEQQIALLHNTMQTLNLTARITQGDANNSRDGDAIVLCGLKLKGFVHSHTSTNMFGYRLLIGYSGEEYNRTTFGAGLVNDEVFLPNTAVTNTELGQINPKAFTVLHDERYTVNSQITDIRDREDFSVYIDLGNKKFPYQSAASIYGKDKSLYVVIVGNVFGGTTGTTIAGGCNITWDFVFKNAS